MLLFDAYAQRSLVIRLATVAMERGPHVALRRLGDVGDLVVRNRKVADAGRSVGRPIVVTLVLVRELLVEHQALVVEQCVKLGRLLA